MNGMKRSLMAAALVAPAMLMSTGAFAQSAETGFVNGLNTIEDSSAEFFVPVVSGVGSTTPAVGDIFVGALAVDGFVESGVNTGVGGTTTELSALFALKIASATPIAVPGICGAASPGNCSGYTYSPLTAAEWAGIVDPLTSTALPAAVNDSQFALVYEDLTPDASASDFAAAGGIAAVLDLVADTSVDILRMVLTMDAAGLGGPAPTDFSLLAPGTAGVGSFANAAPGSVQIFSEFFPNVDFTSPDVGVSGNLFIPATGVFPIGDQTTFFVQARVIPEPGTLGILGSGLAALGFFGWRRQRRKEAATA